MSSLATRLKAKPVAAPRHRLRVDTVTAAFRIRLPVQHRHTESNRLSMADNVTPECRSKIMAAIRGRDTAAELRVRRFLHAAGLRYHLHRMDMPRRLDVVFPGRRLCLFVHGCFWHGCPHCRHGARVVKSNVSYWMSKLARNKTRDAQHQARLNELGWSSLIVWECESTDPKKPTQLLETVHSFPPRRIRSQPVRAK